MGSASSSPSVAPPVVKEDAAKLDPQANVSRNIGSTDDKSKNGGGGCPMDRGDGTYSWDPLAVWKAGFPHAPGGSKPLNGDNIPQQQNDNPEYNVYAQPINPQNQMPSSSSHNQLPAPCQSSPLSTDRVASSIPKGGGDANDGSKNWTYPSPQMFYNALARKNKLDGTSEADMESVVAVHNAMNEATWKQVVEWERVIAGNSNCKLLKFQGRPHDLSPKATFKHYLLGHTRPFDRHDWYIERTTTNAGDDSITTVGRYVLDYYYANNNNNNSDADNNNNPTLVVDVRPALDGPAAVWHRAVTMPYAQLQGTTTYETVPLMPSAGLRSSTNDDETNDTPTVLQQPPRTTTLAGQEALCRTQQMAVQACTTDACVQQASIDLTVCLGQHWCPLQLAALQQQQEDAAVAEAFERLSACVARGGPAGTKDVKN